MKKQNLFDFVLYVGVKDERIRAATDKAGYQTLMLLVVLFAIAALIRALVFGQSDLAKSDVGIVILLSVLFFTIQSYRFGSTFMESKEQKKAVQKYLIYWSVIFVAIGYVLVISKTGPIVAALQSQPILLWSMPIVFGFVAYLVLWLLMSIYENATLSRLKKTIEKTEKDE